MLLPDCPHDSGFRNPVRKPWGADAMCLSCGRWVAIDLNGQVTQHAGEDAVDSFHTRTDNGDDAGTGSQNDHAA